MKNKKLFGKLNIVDIVVILVVVAAAVFFGVRYLGVGGTEQAGSRTLEYEVTIEAMPIELYKEVERFLPAQMVAASGMMDGHILSVTSSPCTVERFESKDPYNTNVLYVVIPPDTREFVRVVFKCQATVAKNSFLNELGTQELRVGRPNIVKSRDFELVGVITSMTEAAS